MGKDTKAKSVVVAVLIVALSSLFASCGHDPNKRSITFDVRPVELPSGRMDGSTDEYWPCEEIRGAESGKILKKVASPGDSVSIALGSDYDFRLITSDDPPWSVDEVVSKKLKDAQDEWQEQMDAYERGESPNPPDDFNPNTIKFNKVIRMGPKAFRIIDASYDDTLIVTFSNAYECVFRLDKDSEGITDRVERIAFCLNENETRTDYRYPLEMSFPASGVIKYYQSINRKMTVRMYMKPGEEYGIGMVMKRRGSMADVEIRATNANPEGDGYYQYVIEPDIDLDKSYSMERCEIIISTGLLHPET